MRCAILFVVLYVPFFAHSQLESFKFDVTAQMEGDTLTPVLFNRLEANTIFAAAVRDFYRSDDSLYVSLLDSCGNEKKSAALAMELVPALGHSYSVVKKGKGYILLVHASLSYGLRLIFLDEDLQPYSAFEIQEVASTRVSALGKNKVLISYFNRHDVLQFWLIDIQSKKSKLYEPLAEKEHEFAAIQGITSNEKGELFIAGEFGFKTDLATYNFFISKYDEDLTNVYLKTYQSGDNLATPYDYGGNLIEEPNGDITFISHGTWTDAKFSTITFDRAGNAQKKILYSHKLVNYTHSSLGEMLPMSGGYVGSANLTNNHRNTLDLSCHYSSQSGITLFKTPALPDQRMSYNRSVSMDFLGNTLTVSGLYFNRSKKGCQAFPVLADLDKTSLNMQPTSSSWQLRLKTLRGAVDFFTVEAKPRKQSIEWSIENECPVETKFQFPRKDTTVCFGTPAKLTSRNEIASVEWNTGANSKSIFSDTAGLFSNQGFSGFCEVVDSHKVIVADSIQLDLPDDTAACPKTVFDFNLKVADYNYEWILPNKTKVVSRFLKTNNSGYHRLRVYGGGCEVMDSVAISFYGFPVAVAGPGGKMCSGDTFKLKGDGGETYLWTPAEFLNRADVKAPLAFPPNTERYRVVVTNKEGCHDTDFVNLTVNPKPVVGFLPLPSDASIADKGVLFTNLGGSSSNYKWFVNQVEQSREANFNFLFPDTGSYHIMLHAVNSDGCSDSAFWQLKVRPEPLMFIPNAFTPNHDGLNDVFAPSSFYYTSYEMTIFNKGGQRIWKSRESNPFPIWDARLDKSLETVPVGTYLYIITAADENGDEHEFSGKVHVVK